MKILNIDIETSPALGWFWQLKTTYIPPRHVEKPKRLLCFAAKWYGSKPIIFQSRWHDGQLKMVERLHGLLNEADAVMHYNGVRFDRKEINTEFSRFDIWPPSPTPNIDLIQTGKSNFAFMSNKLDYITRELGTDRKLENAGMELWLRVLRGDKQAQQEMRLYNIHDVLANEALYDRWLPWISNHPSFAVHADVVCCTNCGGMHYQKRGYHYTKTRVYQRYQCMECGHWFRGTKSIESTGVTS